MAPLGWEGKESRSNRQLPPSRARRRSGPGVNDNRLPNGVHIPSGVEEGPGSIPRDKKKMVSWIQLLYDLDYYLRALASISYLTSGSTKMEPVKIVLRYLDGRIVKGWTQPLDPRRPSFHLLKDNGGASLGETGMEGLKAVFQVKTYAGNPNHRERKKFIVCDGSYSGEVEVTFTDGEVIQGSTIGYDPQQPGFLLFPPDPEGNNINIVVFSSALRDFRYL